VSELRLGETSYVVLGLIEHLGSATPYDLKRLAQLTTANFWTVPHTQLYSECSRLAAGGLLAEQREQTGRRRRIYRLTAAGRRALADWLTGESNAERYVLRDPGTLKLFFGADPAELAGAQLEIHRSRLQSYEALSSSMQEAPQGWRLALEVGIGHEREFIRFWSLLAPQPGPHG
jgi:DNA-binding PadR family transcriptional regulator